MNDRAHETRQERAIRRAVAEEIATVIESRIQEEHGTDLEAVFDDGLRHAAGLAREIGSKETP